MKNFTSTLSVTACGLATSLLVALAIAFTQKMTGFNLFSLSVWFIVPVGAILCGFAAASGYYFGSLYFHTRPNWWLLVQMIIIAGFTQMLIYYVEYSTLVLEDGRVVSQYIGFREYLDLSLTKAHYRFGRAQHDMGEAGDFGYLMAGLQFLGFLAGGIGVYLWLQGKAVCPKCQKYYRKLATKTKRFPDEESFAPFYDNLFAKPVDSAEFKEDIVAVKELPARTGLKKLTAPKGAIELSIILHGCPECKGQIVENTVRVNNGSDWTDVNSLARKVALPEGVNLTATFR